MDVLVAMFGMFVERRPSPQHTGLTVFWKRQKDINHIMTRMIPVHMHSTQKIVPFSDMGNPSSWDNKSYEISNPLFILSHDILSREKNKT